MKLNVLVASIALGLVTAGTALAEEASGGDAAAAPAFTVNGFVSASAQANFYHLGRSNDAAGLRGWNNQYGTFQLDVAQLAVKKAAAKAGDFGARIDVIGGTSIPPGVFADPSAVNVLQAFAEYIFDAGEGLKLTVGRYVTHIGAELIEGVDGYNDFYSRSLLFYNAIPFAHTGLKLDYSFGTVGVQAGVVNGKDNHIDGNAEKSWTGQISIKPNDMFSLYLNGIGGKQAMSVGGSPVNGQDLVADVVAVLKVDALTFTVNFDYHTFSPDVDGAETMTQWGVALAPSYAFSDMVSAAVRYEMFDTGLDPDGSLTDADNLTRSEVTVAITLKPHSNFAIRPEFRMDMSSEDVIWVDRGTDLEAKSSQAVGAIQFIGWF